MSTLYDQIEQEEKELENASKEAEKPDAEKETPEVPAENGQPAPEAVAKAEEAAEEGGPPVEKPEAEDKTEDRPDNAAFARLRREKSALERRLAEIEAAKAAPTPQGPVAVKPADSVPDKAADPAAYAQWEFRQTQQRVEEVAQKQALRDQQEQQARLYQSAVQEFTGYEGEFKKNAQDYEAVARHLRQRLGDSLHALYPNAADNQVEAAVDQQILRFASEYARQGLNPVEELYHITKEKYGYRSTEPEKKKGPDLATIEKNKKRSASPLSAGGQSSGARLTAEAAASMSLAEFSRLTPSQLAELERGAA
ncbi:MAG: hypothetical protein M3O22_00285 [Pseudomonadota bacterium]|nr:hypothetical protein [Pseudomonadota bacterium]